MWAARKEGLSLSIPRVKVRDTPLSRRFSGSEESLEEIMTRVEKVYSNEIFEMVKAVEIAGGLVSRIRQVSDGQLARNMTCVSRIYRECLWLARMFRKDKLKPYELLDRASEELGHRKRPF